MIRHRYLISSRLPKKALYAKQSVYISGLGEDYFTKANTSLEYIRDLFAQKLDGTLQTLPEQRTWRGYPVFTTGNRFFTKQSTLPHESLHSFKQDIDPKSVLLNYAQSSQDRLVHAEENKVRYYERDVSDGIENERYIYFLLNKNSAYS